MKKRSITVLVMAVMMLASVLMGSIPAYAAPGDYLITPQITSNHGSQKYLVENKTDQDATLTLVGSGWTKTVTVGANNSLVVDVAGQQVGTGGPVSLKKDGETEARCQPCSEYRYKVHYKTSGGETVQPSIDSSVVAGKTVTHTAPATVKTATAEYVRSTNETLTKKITEPGDVTFYYVKKDYQAYDITIRYVDQADQEIVRFTENVPVNGTASHQVKLNYTAADGNKYELKTGSPYPINHDYKSGEKTYTASYRLLTEIAVKPYTVTVQYMYNNREIVRPTKISIPGDEKSETLISFQSTLRDDMGKSYTLAPGQASSVNHKYTDSKRNYVVQCTPMADSGAYDVTYLFIDAVSGKELGKESRTVQPGGTVSFQAPVSMNQSGTTYNYVSSQGSRTVSHTYGGGQRVYRIYYNAQGATLGTKVVTLYYVNVHTGEEVGRSALSLEEGERVALDNHMPASIAGTDLVLMSGQSNRSLSYLGAGSGYLVYYRIPGQEVPEVLPTPETVPGTAVPVTEPGVPVEPGTGTDEEGDVDPVDPDTPEEPVDVDPEEPDTPEEQGTNGMSNYWWMILVAIVVLGGTGLVLVSRRKKEKTEETK